MRSSAGCLYEPCAQVESGLHSEVDKMKRDYKRPLSRVVLNVLK